MIFDDELASRRRAWLGEHQPKVKLPDSLVTKLDTFPASYNATRSVALTLDDGSVLDHCLLTTPDGSIVGINGREDFDTPRGIVDVLTRR